MKKLTRKSFTYEPKKVQRALGAATGTLAVTSVTSITMANPSDSGTLVDVSGQKFFDLPLSIHDIHQGVRADCYFLAALGAIIFSQADKIPQMMNQTGKNEFSFNYYNRTINTFDRSIIKTDGQIQSSNNQIQIDSGTYAALSEKSFVQIRGGSWASLDWGWSSQAFRSLGWDSTDFVVTLPNLLNLMYVSLSGRQPVTVSTIGSGTTDGIHESHVYIVTFVDTVKQTVTIYNPWGTGGDSGDGTQTINLTVFLKNFQIVTIATQPLFGADVAPNPYIASIVPIVPPPISILLFEESNPNFDLTWTQDYSPIVYLQSSNSSDFSSIVNMGNSNQMGGIWLTKNRVRLAKPTVDTWYRLVLFDGTAGPSVKFAIIANPTTTKPTVYQAEAEALKLGAPQMAAYFHSIQR